VAVQKHIKQQQQHQILVVVVVEVHTTIFLLELELLAHQGKVMTVLRV